MSCVQSETLMTKHDSELAEMLNSRVFCIPAASTFKSMFCMIHAQLQWCLVMGINTAHWEHEIPFSDPLSSSVSSSVAMTTTTLATFLPCAPAFHKNLYVCLKQRKPNPQSTRHLNCFGTCDIKMRKYFIDPEWVSTFIV